MNRRAIFDGPHTCRRYLLGLEVKVHGSLLLMTTVFTAVPVFAQSTDSKAIDIWHVAPQEIQIIDDRPIVRDFREAPTVPKHQLMRAHDATIYPLNDALPAPDPHCYPNNQIQIIDHRPIIRDFTEAPTIPKNHLMPAQHGPLNEALPTNSAHIEVHSAWSCSTVNEGH